MAFELWSKDEYGQSNIIGRFTEADKLIKRARDEVNNINVDNALTASEKKNAWESYFVDIMEKGQPSERKIYAGNNPDGKHRVNHLKKSGDTSLDFISDADNLRIYLGELDGKTWYATDEKGNEINSLSNRSLDGKTVFFARVIK